jgi:hypothetical protein
MSDKDIPDHVGDIVALVPRDGDGSGNGALVGILWRVVGIEPIKGSRLARLYNLRVEPCWCATGDTVLNPKLIAPSHVRQRIDFTRLGELRMQLDDLCREALAHSSGVTADAPTTEQEGTQGEE